MDDKIIALLEKHCEDDEGLLKNHKYDSKSASVSFTVDMIEKELKVVIAEMDNGIFQVKQDRKEWVDTSSGNLYSVLEGMIKSFEKQRDDLLDTYQGDTPMSDQEESQFNEEEEIEIEDETGEDHLEKIIASDVDATNQYFGHSTCYLVKNLQNVRMTIPADLDEHLLEEYRLEPTASIVLSIQFAPEYIKNTTPPVIKYRPEPNAEAFGHQVSFMATSFLNQRWNILHPFTNNEPIDPDLEYDSKLDIVKQHNYTQQEEKIKFISSLIIKSKTSYAKSLCLYFCNMDPITANQMFVKAGGQDANNTSTVSNNVLMELYAYLMIRLTSLCNDCCICDHSIKIPLLSNKPTICTRFKCQFDFVELGICNSIPITICPSTVSNDILENYYIVDVLISMCYTAAKSKRNEKIFDPFPPQYIDKKNNSKNHSNVVKAIDQLPSVSHMKKHSSTEFDLMKFLGQDRYELVKWILSVGRPALVKMPKGRKIKAMMTEHQYMVMMDSPEKSANFKEMRRKWGSFFAFHGSSTENWHSILRRGLVNASKTALMTNGMAYGEGVYMAEDSTTSLSYAHHGDGWARSELTRGKFKCMAIVEVIKHPHVPQIPNPYYVVKDSNYLSLRFFFIFDSNGNVSVKAGGLKLSGYVQ
ncbi:mono-ADP-ribosyltransferase [Acrasis kona]|uniref:Mono-ADP-ribosyltransferase n=1 Tax=Acrasis kona TaxID=1008807 RepID=A0AAW2Z829_9EUKA